MNKRAREIHNKLESLGSAASVNVIVDRPFLKEVTQLLRKQDQQVKRADAINADLLKRIEAQDAKIANHEVVRARDAVIGAQAATIRQLEEQNAAYEESIRCLQIDLGAATRRGRAQAEEIDQLASQLAAGTSNADIRLRSAEMRGRIIKRQKIQISQMAADNVELSQRIADANATIRELKKDEPTAPLGGWSAAQRKDLQRRIKNQRAEISRLHAQVEELKSPTGGKPYGPGAVYIDAIQITPPITPSVAEGFNAGYAHGLNDGRRGR